MAKDEVYEDTFDPKQLTIRTCRRGHTLIAGDLITISSPNQMYGGKTVVLECPVCRGERTVEREGPVGNCRDCARWASVDEKLGECTLSELTKAESLHVAVVYIRVTEFGLRRTDDHKYKAVLETDASFGCISFEPRQPD